MHNIEDIVLIYVDSEGHVHEQVLADVFEVGTLIDPETGDDMVAIGVDVRDARS